MIYLNPDLLPLFLLLIALVMYRELPRRKAKREIKKKTKADQAMFEEQRRAIEASEASKRQRTIVDAKVLALPDGVFKVACHNRSRGPNSLGYVDPLEVFSTEPFEVVSDWVSRSNRLLSMNYRVGEAMFNDELDGEKLQREFIQSNPGFSNETYSHAIYLGVVAAR